MDDFLRSVIIKEKDSYTVYLYLRPEMAEFAEEFEGGPSPKRTSFYFRVQQYIKKNYPSVKISTVKIVAGSMILSTLPFHKAEADSNPTFTMSYQFLGSGSTFINQVNQTQGNLNTVVPYFFNIDKSGNLLLTKQVTKEYVDTMHSEGIKVVPYMTNNWSRAIGRSAIANREALSTQIANAIKTYNLDGVNVDIENVTEVDRNNYTDFVRLLRQKLPSDKVVSVAIAANPENWTTGWEASYDDSKLAQYANYLFLMAYDESWEGGPEGPVASLPWVEKTVQAALAAGVPSNKLVLGLPFYGRYWKEGDSFGGYGISNLHIQQMLEKYGGTPVMDPVSRSPEVTITIQSTDPPFAIGSSKLGPGVYHIYYENDASLQAKIQLVQKYHLKGTGSWCLGEENPEIWTHYAQWVKGNAASNSSVAGVTSNVQGTNSTQGTGKAPSTISGTGNTINPAVPSDFQDVPTSHWAYADIMNAKDKGWMVGKSATLFEPDQPLKRSEAATVFVRVLGLTATSTTGGTGFKDVPSGYWAKNDIELAKQYGLFTGYPDGTFKPEGYITREQMAVVLNNYLNKNKTLNSPSQLPFSDVSLSHWSAPQILAMYNKGLLTGFPDGQFRPTDTLSRAQMAAIIGRLR